MPTSHQDMLARQQQSKFTHLQSKSPLKVETTVQTTDELRKTGIGKGAGCVCPAVRNFHPKFGVLSIEGIKPP